MLDKIFTPIKEFFFGKYIKSTVRHLLGGLGLALVGIGIDPEVVTQFTESGVVVVSGALTYAVVQLLSWKDKKKNQK